MKTAMQEFLDYMKEYNIILVKEGIEPNLLIKMLQHKAEKLLEQEKQQIIDSYYGNIDGVFGYREEGQEYYNQTYNQKNNL
jgi:uncharacterized protein YaaW (UPF0174 family)